MLVVLLGARLAVNDPTIDQAIRFAEDLGKSSVNVVLIRKSTLFYLRNMVKGVIRNHSVVWSICFFRLMNVSLVCDQLDIQAKICWHSEALACDCRRCRTCLRFMHFSKH